MYGEQFSVSQLSATPESAARPGQRAPGRIYGPCTQTKLKMSDRMTHTK